MKVKRILFKWVVAISILMWVGEMQGQTAEWALADRKGDRVLTYKPVESGERCKGLLIMCCDSLGKVLQEMAYSYPEDTEWAADFSVQLRLEDVTFDGKDDILIGLGSYGNQMVHYEDCYVWDKGRSAYRKDDSFRQIENPQVDVEQRCIFSNARVSAAAYSYGRYEFVNGQFVSTAVLTQTFTSADRPPLYTEEHCVAGKGMVMLHKNVSEADISSYWRSVVMK